MCAVCSTLEEGGPVGARDWKNWFAFWFRRNTQADAGSQDELCEQHAGQADTDTDSKDARPVAVDVSMGL